MKDPANLIADKVAQSLGYDDEKRKVMAYGLGAAQQMLFLLVLAVIFGLLARCLPETMIMFWGVGLMRRSAGGTHCSTYMGCICTSTLSICALSAVCRYVIPSTGNIWYYAAWLGVTFILVGIVFYRLVPVSAPNKPIRNPDKIKRLRIECAITTLIYLAAAILLLFADRSNSRRISLMCAITAVMWWQCFTLTSWSKRLVRYMDRIFIRGQ